MKKDSSQALEQNDWQEFKPLFGGGKIKICDTLRAVTPFGGLSVLIEFFGRIGLVEQLENRQFYQPKSPNHYDPGQILIGFILSVIAGAQRFAHTNQLRADRALQALLGMERFPSDDAILNYFRRFSQAEIQRFWQRRTPMLTSTVYTVASSDSCGLNTQIFITLPAAYSWVADNAEGPSDDIRAELLQLVDQSDFAAFWELLEEHTDHNGYAIQSHTLELQPNFSVI